jgi:hypothetical protein
MEGETLVTAETLSVLVEVHEPEEVAIYRRTMERYRESAMWREEAMQWIQNTVGRIG